MSSRIRNIKPKKEKQNKKKGKDEGEKKSDEKSKKQLILDSEASQRIRAIVRRVSHGIQRRRVGRGFSIEEIKEAGLTLEQAKKLKIYIDTRRKTSHPENISSLRSLSTQVNS